MHQLLDFLYEYAFDKQLYFVLPAEAGDLQLTWRATDPLHWEVRCTSSGPAERLPRSTLLAQLTERSADLVLFEHELRSLAASHIVVADQLLTAAHAAFGSEGVSQVLHGQQRFVGELRQALASLLPPRLRLVR